MPNRRNNRARPAAASHDSTITGTGEMGTELRLTIGDHTVIGWDLTALEPSAREGLAQRIAHYANSQTMGLPKIR